MMTDTTTTRTTTDFSNCDACLFDWDGLVVNTQELLYLSWKAAYREELAATGSKDRDGVDEDEQLLSFEEWSLHHDSGQHDFGAKKALVPPGTAVNKRERMRARRHELYEDMLRRDGAVRLLDGVESFLGELDAQRAFVVTSSSRPEVDLIRHQLRCAALEAIPCSHWFTREAYRFRKPDPDGWNRAIQLAAWEQDKVARNLNVVGFEDTPSGVRSLLSAAQSVSQMTCVLVSPFPYRDAWLDDPRVVRLDHF